MNTLTVQDTSLIGSEEAISMLEKKHAARLLVVSDSHGEAEVLEKIITEFGSDCDALIFCGDGVCDVIACMDESVSDKKLAAALPPVIACVKGNGDAERYPIYGEEDEPSDGAGTERRVCRYFEVQPRVLLRAAGRTVLVVHGNRHGVDFGTETLQSSAEVMDADMVFFGHTHRPYREENGATLLLNPGSCARPRGGVPPTFAVVSVPGSTERYDVEFFELEETMFGGYVFTPFHEISGY
ncbi:metallophosphoesterase [Treponema brennaborense]|uniref:Phosphoesterase n=1 Tax=Treponema brennaborense (strain DSM 12168 / CIP 105900 / DD5/3) TaxID=906968 RepID=F4LPW2_TREBD|nr:metallophosphoesterase [Treponema brennaborense]AEE16054.1 phosphodiesterase, MJ0936 family [Treponema brennaborense DSM 12168]